MAEENGDRSLKQRISELAEKTAISMNMELVLVEIQGAAGRTVVQIFLDRPGGITLDDCEHFSRRFSVVLDVEDFIPFAYVLEVSSPGVNRPLVKEADFQRFIGENAKIRTGLPLDGQRNFKGRIMSAGNGRVELQVMPDKQVVIPLTAIEKASLIADLTGKFHKV